MSAVILAVIVIMWAVVLVPMWLRRHENAVENRSADRFSTAMRVLSRRQPARPDRRYVLMPKRERDASVHVSGAAAPRAAAPRAAKPKARVSLATRRRRVFLALAGVTLLTFVLTVAGVLGWVLQLVIDLALVAYVVHLRSQAKRVAAASRVRRPAPAPAPAVRRPAYRPMSRPVATGTMRAPSYADVAVPSEVAVEATGTDDRRSEWDPVPVPPPTYTMKPQAPQHWTYEAPAADTATHPADEPQMEAAAAELDEILEHRWAVND